MYLTSLFLLFLPVFYFRFINPDAVYRLLFLRFFLVVEFSLITIFLYYNISHRILKRIMLFIPIIFLVYSIYDYLGSEVGKFSYKPLVAECLILLVYIIYFFYEKIQSNTSTPIYMTRVFWIAVAFTIYCAGNFFIFLYSNNPVKDNEYFFQFTLIYSTFTIIKNVALCIGLIIKQPVEKNKYQDFITQNSLLDTIGIEKGHQ